MDFRENSPIIFIGMHRSGTSLLGRLLEQLGLFVGKEKDKNNEAVFFLELNSWLMAQCGGRWDNPLPILDVWKSDASLVLTASKNYINDLMSSPRAVKYLGFRQYYKYKSIQKMDINWGWKDPRNTYTLPLWLEIFPNARIIFIERHGVDVAESLRVRSRKTVETSEYKYQKFKPLTWFRPKRGGFSESPRCLSLEGGFSLWQDYQKEAYKNMASINDHKIFKVRYEELLVDTDSILEDAARFCGLTPTKDEIQEVTKSIRSDRAYSYLKDENLVKVAERNIDTLSLYGYV